MSTPDENQAASNKNQAAFSSEITMNGKTYRDCIQHVIYYVTKSSRYSQHSLVDRGANGGVTGNDVRFIETHPDRKVDIRGIDNYQISDIPLVSARGVTTTITNEVIVIIHQHAHHGNNKIVHSSPKI